MDFGQKFEPKGNRIIHGAGQSIEQFRKYWNVTEYNKPLVYMAYNRINDIQEKFPRKLKELCSIDKKLWLQLGLNLKPKGEKEKCREIVQGKYDKEIDFLVKTLKNFKNPVFLRIGYEFNNPTHNYKPSEFIQAWKYIVDFFRKNKIDNVAFVWDACTAFNRDLREIMIYYPGDEYVDWFGNNLFGIQHFKDNEDKVTEGFAEESELHRKPLIICESSATKSGVLKGKESWDLWFYPFFKWIKSHPVTKAFCYIDWDWAVDWKIPEWGNCRIEENLFVKEKYIQELSNKEYIHVHKSKTTFFRMWS